MFPSMLVLLKGICSKAYIRGSVILSQAGVLSKWLKVWSRKWCHTIAQGLRFLEQKIYEILMESLPTGMPNAGGVAKNCICRPIEKSLAQMLYCQKFVSIHHGRLHSRWCAGRGISGVINNSGRSRIWWSQLRSSWHQ